MEWRLRCCLLVGDERGGKLKRESGLRPFGSLLGDGCFGSDARPREPNPQRTRKQSVVIVSTHDTVTELRSCSQLTPNTPHRLVHFDHLTIHRGYHEASWPASVDVGAHADTCVELRRYTRPRRTSRPLTAASDATRMHPGQVRGVYGYMGVCAQCGAAATGRASNVYEDPGPIGGPKPRACYCKMCWLATSHGTRGGCAPTTRSTRLVRDRNVVRVGGGTRNRYDRCSCGCKRMIRIKRLAW